MAKKSKKSGSIESILLNLPAEQKTKIMHDLGMSIDNPTEIADIADNLAQNGSMEEAYNLYSRASGLGYARATTCKGCCLLKGDGCPKDHRAALKAFEQSAGQGDKWGALSAAVMYHTGLGIKSNDVKAEKYLKDAIENELSTRQSSEAGTKK